MGVSIYAMLKQHGHEAAADSDATKFCHPMKQENDSTVKGLWLSEYDKF